jgi:hypothetical protein
MNKKNDLESSVRLSLLDVMYGVVLAYGFTYFDKAGDGTDYFRFFFAYAVFVFDYIYVHRQYWKTEYKNLFLAMDIGVLFSISRMLATSTTNTSDYFLWLSVLFSLYVAWDVISKVNKSKSEYDWRYSICGDVFASIAFYLIWLTPIQQTKSTLLIIFFTLSIYGIAFSTWFKKAPAQKN